MSSKNRNQYNHQKQQQDQAMEQTQEQSAQDQDLQATSNQELNQEANPQDQATEQPQQDSQSDSQSATEATNSQQPQATTTEATQAEAVVQAAEVIEPAPVATTAEPVQQAPVARARHQAKSTPLPQATAEEGASVASLIQTATEEKNIGMQILIKNLEDMNLAFSRRVQTTPQQAGANMVSLHRVLLNVLNTDKTQAEFRAQWNFVLTFFKENEADGFSMTRMYRGAPFWTLSHDEYQTFQALINLIEASNRWGVEGCRKHINFVKLTKHPVTESGRGRLLSFYN